MKLNLTAVVVNTSLVNMNVAVFSLKFSSAGKGPFMASKAKKNMRQRWHFPGGKGGSGVEDMAHARWEI